MVIDLIQTCAAGGCIGGDMSPCFARPTGDNTEQVRHPANGYRAAFDAVDPGQRWALELQRSDKILQLLRTSPHLYTHAFGIVPDRTPELMQARKPPDCGSEADPLHCAFDADGLRNNFRV